MSPSWRVRLDSGPQVHWIHRATNIPGLFVAWCGHRVWKHGPRYGDRRPTGLWGNPQPPPSKLTCRKCRRHLPIIYTVRRGPGIEQRR